MTDDEHQLRATLAELQSQLEASETLDEEVRARLRNLIDDIDRRLAQAHADEETLKSKHHESLVHNLAEAARHFEESHPTLAGAVGSVIDALSRMGI